MSTHERVIDHLIQTTSEMVLPPSFLDHLTSWSAERGRPASEGRPVTVREYIASRAPQNVRESLGIAPQEMGDPVKKVGELTDEELRELTLAIVQRESDATFVIGEESYSREDQIAGIKQGTEIGIRLLRAVQQNGRFQQGLIDSGKLLIGEEPTGFDLPDFKF